MTTETIEADTTDPPARGCLYPACTSAVSKSSPNLCDEHARAANRWLIANDRDADLTERQSAKQLDVTLPNWNRSAVDQMLDGKRRDTATPRIAGRTGHEVSSPAVFTAPGHWSARAACAWLDDGDVMLPPIESVAACVAGKALCAACSVVEPCLADALAHSAWRGIYGATTSRQRVELRREMRAAA